MRRDDTAMLIVFGREHHAAESRRGGSAEVDEDSEEQACEFWLWKGVGPGVVILVVASSVCIAVSTTCPYHLDTCTMLLRSPGLGVDRPRPCSAWPYFRVTACQWRVTSYLIYPDCNLSTPVIHAFDRVPLSGYSKVPLHSSN